MRIVLWLILFIAIPMVSQAAPGDLLWAFNTGGEIKSSVAIDDEGCLYFGVNDPLADDPSANNRIVALNSDGSLKWQYRVSDWVDASPALSDDGVLYVGCWDGNIYALNSDDGSLKWKWEGTGVIIASVAIGENGVLYCSDGDQALVAIDPETGIELWWTDLMLVGDWIDSSPAISQEGFIYFGSWDGRVYEVNEAGQDTGWVGATNNVIVGSPCIGVDGTVYIGSEDGYIYAFTPGVERPKWMFDTGSSVNGSPVIGGDGSVLIGSGGGYLYSLNAQTGAMNWSFPVGDVVFSTPAVDADGNIYFGSGDQYVYAVDADGHFLWDRLTGGWVDASPSLGKDGTVYVGSFDGYLYALEGSSELAWGVWPRFRANLSGSGRTDAYRLWVESESLADGNPEGDEDGDGLANIWEFALGLNPLELDSKHLMNPLVDREGGESNWTWWWREGVSGVKVEASADLHAWYEVYPHATVNVPWLLTTTELSGEAMEGLELNTGDDLMSGWFIRLKLIE